MVREFTNEVRRSFAHLLSIKMARSNVADILQNWDSHTSEIKSALHGACVISYARPFTQSATNKGKITYPTRQIVKVAGFDTELHKHILDLRNQIIAHGDYGIFPSTMYLQTIGDARLPIVLGINVKGMFGIASRDLALRYDKHFSICDDRLEQLLNLECSELAAEAKLHPDAFNATHNIPEVHEGSIPLEAKLSDLPRPTGPAGTVENPLFPDGLSDYNYITLTHQITLLESGEYVITTNGIEQKITVSIE